ncbi:hypothetical protein ACLB2K_019030 [Fragaria x ananassa]
MAPKNSNNSFVKKLLADNNGYLKAATKATKCYKLKNKVWELSVLCDVIVSLIVIGPDGKVLKENLDEVKSILREYWLKKRLDRSSDHLLEVVLEEIKKRTVDIDRNWLAAEELRDMWNSLESQLEAVIEKTSGVVRGNETIIGDMRKSMMQILRYIYINELLHVHYKHP